MIKFDLAHRQMQIVGSDGQPVGVLLEAHENALLLAGGDPKDADAPRLPIDLVERIDTVIRLNAPAREIIKRWLSDRPEAFDSAPTTS